MARPTVVTPYVLRKVEEAFAIGCTDLEACVYADISKTTLYDYQLANPGFAERKEELKEKPVLKARSTIVKALSDPSYAFKYMERKKKGEFGANIEVSGNLSISQVLDQLQNGQETPE